MGSSFSNKSTQRAPKFSEADAAKFLKRGYDFLKVHKFQDAGACCGLVLKYMPQAKEVHFLVGLIGIETKDWATARQAFKNVVGLDEHHAAAWAQLSRTFMAMGQYSNAEVAVEKATDLQPNDPLVQDVIGTVYSLLGDQKTALRWFDMACENSTSAAFELSRAKSLTFLGKIPEAKTALQAVIAERPASAQAHWMLSRVEKAQNDEHIQQMQLLAEKAESNSSVLPFLHYAMGKECEDLEDWAGAFENYQLGAKARRNEVAFDEDAETKMFETLKTTYNKEWFAGKGGGLEDMSPIFVIGQPRTGTTLIERIMTAHIDVQSAGELQQFGMAIKRLAGISSPKAITPEIIAKAATEIDPAQLAQLYMDTTASVRPDSPRFVDKLPVNYLYAPLIAAAFPNAKIIHVVRGAMDSCFSSYKQLFADAYYHSYDQEEMARHHLRYRDLMDHWRAVLGPRMLDVQYEDVVADLEPNARKIIAHLGLKWQDACLDFHNQTSAVTTASAVQVREKAHSKSVGRWKKFEDYLGPMKKVVEGEGL